MDWILTSILVEVHTSLVFSFIKRNDNSNHIATWGENIQLERSVVSQKVLDCCGRTLNRLGRDVESEDDLDSYCFHRDTANKIDGMHYVRPFLSLLIAALSGDVPHCTLSGHETRSLHPSLIPPSIAMHCSLWPTQRLPTQSSALTLLLKEVENMWSALEISARLTPRYIHPS